MSGTATIDTIATVIPSVTLHATPSDTVCTGTNVTYTPIAINGGTTPTYQWSVNGVNVATTAIYSFVPANGDVVTAVMTSHATCPAPATATTTMTAKVDPYATPSLSLTADPSDTICKGTLVTVTPIPMYGGIAPTYTWMKNGVLSGAGVTYSYVPLNHDEVYAIMQSNYHCRLNSTDTSAVMVLIVDSAAQPIVSISTSPNTLISTGQTVTLTAAVTNGGTAPTYQWYLNSVPQPAATNATWTDSFNTAGNDSVSVQVTSSGICPVTGHDWVYINVANVGVKSIAGADDITIIPNPNKGDFLVKGTVAGTDKVSLELTDVLGQSVYRTELQPQAGRLNDRIHLSTTLANGMYLLTLRTASGTTVLHMVVEQ
jgi:hypothetical protein